MESRRVFFVAHISWSSDILSGQSWQCFTGFIGMDLDLSF